VALVAQILAQEVMEQQGLIPFFRPLLLLAEGLVRAALLAAAAVAEVVVAPERLVVQEITQLQAHHKGIMLVLQHPALIITVLAAVGLVV
jgi:hypothetical protein